MRRLILVGVCLLVPSLLSAQTQVPANRELSAVWNHDGVDTDGYRVRIDGAQIGQDLPRSALSNGEVRAALPGQSPGTHVLTACAFNVSGESCVDLAFRAVDRPSAPSNLQLVVRLEQQADGTWRLRVESVEPAD